MKRRNDATSSPLLPQLSLKNTWPSSLVVTKTGHG
jgi:hypothetical protein